MDRNIFIKKSPSQRYSCLLLPHVARDMTTLRKERGKITEDQGKSVESGPAFRWAYFKLAVRAEGSIIF